MALIIEDGTNVANADSYATAVELAAYATARQLTIPAAQTDREVLLVKAADYLLTFEGDFLGSRTNTDQTMSFPRDYITVFGAVLDGTIPDLLKRAQCQIAYDAIANDLQATTSGRVVKKEGVGPLQVEYADGESNPQVVLDKAISILKPLFKASSTANGGGININATR